MVEKWWGLSWWMRMWCNGMCTWTTVEQWCGLSVNMQVIWWCLCLNCGWLILWSEIGILWYLCVWLVSGVVFVTVTAAWYIAGSLPLDSLTSSGLYMKDFGNLLFLYWLLLFSVLWRWSIYGNYFSGCLFHWKLQNSINSLLCTYFNKCTAYVSDFLLTSSFSFPWFRAFIKWTTS